MKRRIDAHVQEIWYGESPLRWFLQPFAWLYGAAVGLRHAMYAGGLLRSIRVSAPVIVVGNIAVGGTGKTPLTLWLVGRLRDRGFSPGIVSRGYGGSVGPHPVEVTAASDPAVTGDEAVLLAGRSGCPVVVHADRVAAAKRAIELGADVILSDDGLQHYRLQRDVEVVVVDGTRQFGNRQLLPAGPLREPLSRLARVQQVVVQREPGGGPKLALRATDPPPLEFQLLASTARSLDNSNERERKLGAWTGRKVHALAGIGNPDRFFRLLESHGIEVVRHPLPDHAEIVAADLAFDDDSDVLMTEKDAVKCRAFSHDRCWYVPVDVAMDDASAEMLVECIASALSPHVASEVDSD